MKINKIDIYQFQCPNWSAQTIH